VVYCLLRDSPYGSELNRGEKGQQIENVAGYQNGRNAYAAEGLASLQKTARDRQNVFASLMEAVKTHSLGQISHALYDVGGGGIVGICDAFYGRRSARNDRRFD
jgi:hypothetical protein